MGDLRSVHHQNRSVDGRLAPAALVDRAFRTRVDDGALPAAFDAPPRNLTGPEVVRDRLLIAGAAWWPASRPDGTMS